MATTQEIKAKIAKAKKSLQQQREKLPRVTQRSLREKRSGLQGRQTRRRLSEQLGEISLRERQISEAELQLSEIETQQEAFKKAQAERQALIAEQQRKQGILNRHIRGKPLNRSEQFELQKLFDANQGLEDSIREIKMRGDVASLTKKQLESLPVEKLEELKRFGVRYEVIETPADIITPPPSPSTIKFLGDKTNGDNLNVSVGDGGGLYDSLRRRFAGFVGDSGDRKEGREIFIKELGGFASATGTEFGTSQIRPVTPEEKFKIDKASYWGSLSGIAEAEKRAGEFLFGKQPNVRVVNQSEFDALKSSGQIGGGLEIPKFATTPFDVASEGALRVGEYTDKKFIPQDVKQQFPVLDTNVSREKSKEALSKVLMISAFAPLTATGTAQQSAYTEVIDKKTGQRIFIKKTELEEFLLKGKNLSFAKKAERVNALLKNALNPETRTKVLNLAREIYGDKFMIDFFAQESIGFGFVQSKEGSQIFVEVPKVTQIKNIGKTTTALASTTLNPFAVGESTMNAQQVGQLDVIGDMKMDTKQKQVQINALGLKSAQQTKQSQLTKQKQQTKQDTKLLQRLSTLSALRFGTPSTTTQTTRQTGRTSPPRTDIFKPRPKRPKTIIPTPKKKSSVVQLYEKMSKSPKLFQAFGRRFGKDVRLGTFETQSGAETALKKFLVGSLGRSGFVSKRGKKVRTNIFGGQFRPSKVEPLRIVQRKEFSLSSPSERKEISFFRKQKRRKKASFF